jgi:uncharacterized membrane protein
MTQTFSPGASRRMEALSDGIIAIVATLLVLEIRVPKLPDPFSTAELTHALKEILPSLIAFIFSFLNILVFWYNHDTIAKTLYYFDKKLSFLNFFFLMFISLVPFTTAFVSEYPFSLTAVTVYGLVLMTASLFATWMYHHIAFRSDMMHKGINMKTRKLIWRRVVAGPVSFAGAILLGFVHVGIPIAIYIFMPLFFMFMPQPDLTDNEGA